MSEVAPIAPQEDEGDAAPEAEKPAKNRKRLVLLVAGILLLLAAAGGATWYFTRSAEPADKVEESEPPEAFVDVPAMQVQIRAADGSSRMLKLHVMLVPGSLTAEELTNRLPQLIDRFQPFLRELRPEDLAGSAATFRMKEELLIRSNQALGAGSVRDVLIQDLMQG
jgi:flagellar FliL protein